MSREQMFFNKAEMNCILENKYLERDLKQKLKNSGLQIQVKNNLQFLEQFRINHQTNASIDKLLLIQKQFITSQRFIQSLEMYFKLIVDKVLCFKILNTTNVISNKPKIYFIKLMIKNICIFESKISIEKFENLEELFCQKILKALCYPLLMNLLFIQECLRRQKIKAKEQEFYEQVLFERNLQYQFSIYGKVNQIKIAGLEHEKDNGQFSACKQGDISFNNQNEISFCLNQETQGLKQEHQNPKKEPEIQDGVFETLYWDPFNSVQKSQNQIPNLQSQSKQVFLSCLNAYPRDIKGEVLNSKEVFYEIPSFYRDRIELTKLAYANKFSQKKIVYQYLELKDKLIVIDAHPSLEIEDNAEIFSNIFLQNFQIIPSVQLYLQKMTEKHFTCLLQSLYAFLLDQKNAFVLFKIVLGAQASETQATIFLKQYNHIVVLKYLENNLKQIYQFIIDTVKLVELKQIDGRLIDKLKRSILEESKNTIEISQLQKLFEKITNVQVINIDIFFDQNLKELSGKTLLNWLQSQFFYEQLVEFSQQQKMLLKIEQKLKINKVEILLQNEGTWIIQVHCYYQKGDLENLLTFIQIYFLAVLTPDDISSYLSSLLAFYHINFN